MCNTTFFEKKKKRKKSQGGTAQGKKQSKRRKSLSGKARGTYKPGNPLEKYTFTYFQKHVSFSKVRMRRMTSGPLNSEVRAKPTSAGLPSELENLPLVSWTPNALARISSVSLPSAVIRSMCGMQSGRREERKGPLASRHQREKTSLSWFDPLATTSPPPPHPPGVWP